MTRRILLLQGHPDPAGNRFGHALAAAYRDGAEAAGHVLREVDVARLSFPVLRSKHEWESEPLPSGLVDAQAGIARAEHLVLFFPLWLGTMPALLKAFLEQTLRPGFAVAPAAADRAMARPLVGRSARVVVTMGMPALAYRWWFGAHGVRGLERSILRFCGIGPVREAFVGAVEGDAARREKWLRKLRALGRAGC